MITISLKEIKKCDPCEYGMFKLMQSLGKQEADDERFPFSKILESNSIFDAIWAFRCLPQHIILWRRFCVDSALEVKEYIQDPKADVALWAADNYLKGNIELGELRAISKKVDWERSFAPAEWAARHAVAAIEYDAARVSPCCLAAVGAVLSAARGAGRTGIRKKLTERLIKMVDEHE